MPMSIVPMFQAKSSLSQLVKRAVGGETIFIGSYGRPEAVLLSEANFRPKKRLGLVARPGSLIISQTLRTHLPFLISLLSLL